MDIQYYVNLIKFNNITVEKVVRKYYTQNINSSKLCECPFHASKTKKSLVVSPTRDIFFFKCFGCDISGDTIDFVSKYCNISKIEAAKMICQDFGVDIGQIKKIQYIPRPKVKKVFKEKKIILDLTSFILDANKKDSNYDYFLKERNISKRIINKYKLCKIDPRKILDKNYLPNLNMSKYSNILPVWYRQKVVSIICRRIDNNKDVPRYANLKGIPMYIFNQMKLLANNINTIYVCESMLDSLSIESLGGHSISLNSTSNKQYLIDYIIHYYRFTKNKMFILCGDEDEAGEKMNEFLSKNFKQIKINYKIFDVEDDVNSMHVKNNLKIF